jgi:hypothetical protein
VDSIHVAQDKDQCQVFMNSAMNIRIPENVWNLYTSWETVSFSRRTPFREDEHHVVWVRMSAARPLRGRANTFNLIERMHRTETINLQLLA